MKVTIVEIKFLSRIPKNGIFISTELLDGNSEVSLGLVF